MALGITVLAIAGIMYYVGSTNSHLSELADTFWVPIPVGVLLILLGIKEKKG